MFIVHNLYAYCVENGLILCLHNLNELKKRKKINATH